MKVELTIKNESVHFEINGASVIEPLANFPATVRHLVESKRDHLSQYAQHRINAGCQECEE